MYSEYWNITEQSSSYLLRRVGSLWVLCLVLFLQILLSGCKTSRIAEKPNEKIEQRVAQAGSPRQANTRPEEETDIIELIKQVRIELRNINVKLRDFYNKTADDQAIKKLRQNGTEEDYYKKLNEVAEQIQDPNQRSNIIALLKKKQSLVYQLRKLEERNSSIRRNTFENEKSRSYQRTRFDISSRPKPDMALDGLISSEQLSSSPGVGAGSRSGSSSRKTYLSNRGSFRSTAESGAMIRSNDSHDSYRSSSNRDSDSSVSGRRRVRIIRKISGRRVGSRKLNGSAFGVPTSRAFVRPVETRRQVVVTEGEKKFSLSDKAFSGSSAFVRPASSRVIVTEEWGAPGKDSRGKLPSAGPGRAFRISAGFGANAFGGIDEGNAKPSSTSVIMQNIQLRKELQKKEKELEEKEKHLRERQRQFNIDGIRNRGRR